MKLHQEKGTGRILELVKTCPGVWIFADGGMLTSPPNPVGFYAWRLVVDGRCKAAMEGTLKPIGDDPWVTNNTSEHYAVLMALDFYRENNHMADCRPVNYIASDSLCILRRMFEATNPWGSNSPDAIKRLREWQTDLWPTFQYAEGILLSGHPRKSQLETGIGPRGYPCSEHNVACDTEMNAMKKRLLAAINEKFGNIRNYLVCHMGDKGLALTDEEMEILREHDPELAKEYQRESAIPTGRR